MHCKRAQRGIDRGDRPRRIVIGQLRISAVLWRMGRRLGRRLGQLGRGSTVAGSYMAGMSEAIRAEGQYNLLTSEAAINAQQAASLDIDNQVKWTNAYFEMRKINRENRPKSEPVPQETWVRLAQAQAPKRLNSGSLDPITGNILWPSVLLDSAFESERETLEGLFAHRALTHGAIGINAHRKIRAATDKALDVLKSKIREIDSRNYVECKNFLNSLAYEADFPTS